MHSCDGRSGPVRFPHGAVRRAHRSWIVVLAIGLTAPGSTMAVQNPDDGRQTFQTYCAMCHTIGGGRLIGPDLLGVADRRSEDWLIRFVQRSQQMIKAGDAAAVALFQEYGQMIMPDQPVSADQVRGIIAHIRAGAVGDAAPTVVAPASEEQIQLGRDLFQGNVGLANGGPTCISCHDVTHDAIIGGGVLAAELTTVFSRLGGPGVRAILGSPPFPVMQRAYQGRALAEHEIVALVGFLQRADEEQSLHQPRDYGPKLFTAGVTGTALLLGLYSMLWGRRLRGSVNQSIYDRQITSS